MKEVWRPVRGYERLYEVSSLGAVRSLDRVVTEVTGAKRRIKGKVLRQCKAVTGHRRPYVRLTVSLMRDGVRKQAPVARLVAIAFVPNLKRHPVVRHSDGDSTNNAASNLSWGTHQDNSDDAVKAGAMPRGASHFNSKLSKAQALEIKNSPQTQAVAKELAERFGVHYATIRSVWQGKSWQWL